MTDSISIIRTRSRARRKSIRYRPFPPLPLLSALLLFFLPVGRGEAALYCLLDFGGERCVYTSLSDCQVAAGKKGRCFLNERKMLHPTGGAPFCVLESWQTECIYPDLARCTLVAQRRGATCIANPNLTNAPLQAAVPNAQEEREAGEEPASAATPGQYLPSPAYQPTPGHR